MLIKDRLKTIDDPAFLLGAAALCVDDVDRITTLLEYRLKQLVEHAIAEVGFDHNGVYFIILGDPCERRGDLSPQAPIG